MKPSATLHYQFCTMDQQPLITEQIQTLNTTSSWWVEIVENPRHDDSWEKPWVLPLGVLAMVLSSSVIGSSSSGGQFLVVTLKQFGIVDGVGSWLSSTVLPVVVSMFQKIIWIEVWRQVWNYIDVGCHEITILNKSWPSWMRQLYNYGQGVIQRGTEKLMKKSMEQTGQQLVSAFVRSLWSSISIIMSTAYS